jgi:uncharacterized C2H2 Zn-finger protein
MQSQPYKCNICGMIFVNSKELAKHQIDVHINELFQCQSCNKVFGNSQEFEKHAIEVHGSGDSHYPSKSNSDGDSMGNIQYNNDNKKEVVVADNDSIESKLLRQTNGEEKARKRNRGPYRKSSKHFVIMHGLII